MDSPTLITHFEHCDRKGFWSRDFEPSRPDANEMLHQALRVGLTSDRSDFGQAAGEYLFSLGERCSLETGVVSVFDQIVHLSALAEIITVAIRKPSEGPWRLAEDVDLGGGVVWHPRCYVNPQGTALRRVVMASSWNDDRHYHESRSWHSLGEICALGLPMQQVVCVLGQNRDGKRRSPWCQGLLHPRNMKLRFRKKNDLSTGFKDSWTKIWREDYDQISTKEWLQGMYEDHVLEESLFNVDIALPTKLSRERIQDLAAKKLERIYRLKQVPDQNLSICDWPSPCIFRTPCHSLKEPSQKYGFVQIGQHIPANTGI